MLRHNIHDCNKLLLWHTRILHHNLFGRIHPMTTDTEYFLAITVFIFILAWLVGRDIDIQPVDIEKCISSARSSKKIPRWVPIHIFQRLSLEVFFYDWSELDAIEWNRLHASIHSISSSTRHYDLTSLHTCKTIEDLIYMIAFITTHTREDFKATVQTLYLMIVDTEILVSYDRIETYNQKVTALVDRYTRQSTS